MFATEKPLTITIDVDKTSLLKVVDQEGKTAYFSDVFSRKLFAFLKTYKPKSDPAIISLGGLTLTINNEYLRDLELTLQKFIEEQNVSAKD